MNLTWFQRSRSKARKRNGSTQREKVPHYCRSAYGESDLVYQQPVQRRAYMISLSLLLLLIQAATGQEWPNPTYLNQLTPGVTSPVREKIPLLPSTTSWHHWHLQAFLPKWGSLQNGFAFLQKYRTVSTVHFQCNSVGSTDYLYCLNNSVSATFSPSKKN